MRPPHLGRKGGLQGGTAQRPLRHAEPEVGNRPVGGGTRRGPPRRNDRPCITLRPAHAGRGAAIAAPGAHRAPSREQGRGFVLQLASCTSRARSRRRLRSRRHRGGPGAHARRPLTGYRLGKVPGRPAAGHAGAGRGISADAGGAAAPGCAIWSTSTSCSRTIARGESCCWPARGKGALASTRAGKGIRPRFVHGRRGAAASGRVELLTRSARRDRWAKCGRDPRRCEGRRVGRTWPPASWRAERAAPATSARNGEG